ncbi:hypothetical protein CYMTET_4032 [Cymbomonas tetramitiformis]|uniref:Uncharacterized protein n=1 Tax=Cymbomonas tetramitiformis TaxID=36881 RepID=A0AAE0H277_9CHLO|nr:hypothetical protein CYMTET_4032 [Cymbomonas tetramitiformis]
MSAPSFATNKVPVQAAGAAGRVDRQGCQWGDAVGELVEGKLWGWKVAKDWGVWRGVGREEDKKVVAVAAVAVAVEDTEVVMEVAAEVMVVEEGSGGGG